MTLTDFFATIDQIDAYIAEQEKQSKAAAR